ncbi:phage portal protein [Variovorax atrisoli]|uniref:phage portal protein n=1 Tax=Variovorax atrisoli TaxID=3394203 RepID=UPI003398AC2B
MRADLKALADIVIQSVKAAVAPLARRLDDIDSVIKGVPESLAPHIEQTVKKAVDALPPAKDGKDFPVNEVQRMVADAVAALPPAKDGADGASVTVADLEPLVSDVVAKAIALIPAPKEESTFPAEEVRRMVEEEVEKSFSAIPRPKDGEPGRSVTAEELAPMVTDEVAKAVAAIPAPKDGESVPVEEVKKMIDEAVAAAVAAIPPAQDGRDGQAGRDALQIELLPEIDLAKSYARGTYARHAGGMWRAFEATKGLHGWECVVDGIAELRIDQPGGREFTLVARTSSGAEVAKSIKVAALVDKGVFRAEEAYEAGDGVTWGGSFFIAQKDAPIGKPGEPGCNGWRLAVKRGRDAGKAVQL